MLTTFPKTDAALEAQIREELRWDCRTEGSAIQVQAQEGVVTLQGKVANYAIKCAAEEATHRITGVQALQNEIEVRIPFGAWKTDIEIAEAAARAFEWDVLVPHKKVGAIVTSGWVELVGEVDCWSQREEVERVVSRLAGVLGVTNSIRVQAAKVEPSSVCAAIEATLERHSPHEAETVHVAMEAGTIRLTGQVPDWEKRCTVLRAAGFAPGVRQIVDELKVAVNS